MLKIDIRDFFMSGEHNDLLRHAMKGFDQTHRTELGDLLDHILTTQYVDYGMCDGGRTGPCAQVKIGSGMGLICSGEVSDFCFLELVDKPSVLNPLIREQYEVHFYGRFKDDMLVILGGSSDPRWNSGTN